jgi:hypothetical protein
MRYENQIEIPDNSKLKKTDNFDDERRAEKDKLFDKAWVDVYKLKRGIGDPGAVTHMKEINIKELIPEDYDAYANTFLSDNWYENCSALSEYHQNIQLHNQAKLAVNPKYKSLDDSRYNFYGMIKNKLIRKNQEKLNKQNGNKS